MKSFLLFFLFLFNSHAFSFDIQQVQVSCSKSESCEQLTEVFKSVQREYNDEAHFYKILKLYVAYEGVKKFSFSVDDSEGFKTLRIKLEPKKILESLSGPMINGPYEIELPTVLPLKVGEYLDDTDIESTIRLIKEIARDKGFPFANVRVDVKEKESTADAFIKLDLGRPTLVESIAVNSRSKKVELLLMEKLGVHIGKAFDAQLVKNQMEDLRKILLQYGYYLVDFDLKTQSIGDFQVKLIVDISNVQTYSFHTFENKFFTQEDLKSYLSGQLLSLKRKLSAETVQQLIRDHYKTKGFRDTKVSVKVTNSINNFGDTNFHYLAEIKEFKRTFFNKLQFKGSSYFKDKELRDLFYSEAPESIDVKALNISYFNQFKAKLRELYISRGFVSVFISNPDIQEKIETEDVTVSYLIREGIQTRVEKLNIKGVPQEFQSEVLSLMENQAKKPFNPIAFKSDLKQIQSFLREKGYYFAEITNLSDRSLVVYEEDNSIVNLNIAVSAGQKHYVDNIVIIGNRKTRRRLIERELSFDKGDLLKRSTIESSQTTLLALGLFSSVQIKPVKRSRTSTDIIIFVREKDFGVIEVAPGVRSDVGLKISTSLNYNNIDGMNKKLSLRASVNRRFDLNALDEVRRKNSRNLVEYDTTATFSENHIFRSDYDAGLVLNKSRRRFFSFDADIQRISYTVSRDFTSWFRASIRQQLETISQFEATQEKFQGFFQVGSFTPSVTFDFRNRSVNPTKGAKFDLSVEFANPFFLSQNTDELEIDYYKLTSRNTFYIPLLDRSVIAMQATYGIQENLATERKANGEAAGYIPGIKVFRLAGADIIRGFEDDEMNRLASGVDISSIAVETRAYMFNFKFEPRYFISESMVVGAFYDAGRVWVDQSDFSDLRSSVGLSFKYLTPVGTLDFNYGIKLLRKRDSSGSLESPGRLHVSIGFF